MTFLMTQFLGNIQQQKRSIYDVMLLLGILWLVLQVRGVICGRSLFPPFPCGLFLQLPPRVGYRPLIILLYRENRLWGCWDPSEHTADELMGEAAIIVATITSSSKLFFLAFSSKENGVLKQMFGLFAILKKKNATAKLRRSSSYRILFDFFVLKK